MHLQPGIIDMLKPSVSIHIEVTCLCTLNDPSKPLFALSQRPLRPISLDGLLADIDIP